MEAWSSPDVPSLPGRGAHLQIHDTSANQVVEITPTDQARLYVCGITPYDATHLGHAATYIAFDLMQRVWLDAGTPIRYVQNVTDIDDPLLERAVETGQDWNELALAETALFREDMAALRVLAPAAFIGAVETIPAVVRLVQELVGQGAAYFVGEDIYFSVASDPGFGRVSHLDRSTMLNLSSQRGGDPQREGKKDPLDPLLWLSAREGEPAWDTALGHGRPGWHIECVAIAREYLGDGFDVQGGGSDLTFPHHEMGASHAHVLGDDPFAQAYVHSGMVGLNGSKMSKSQGNLVFVSRLRDDGHDPMAIRLALLAHHYRSDWEWQDADLSTAESRLHLWRMAATADAGPAGGPVLDSVRAALADDLNAPQAVAAIDAWAEQASNGDGPDPKAPALIAAAADALLGVKLV